MIANIVKFHQFFVNLHCFFNICLFLWKKETPQDTSYFVECAKQMGWRFIC